MLFFDIYNSHLLDEVSYIKLQSNKFIMQPCFYIRGQCRHLMLRFAAQQIQKKHQE